MATSSSPTLRWAGLAAVAGAGLIAIVLSSAGSSSGRPGAGGARTAGGHLTAVSWPVPARASREWRSATISSLGATLFYPPDWKPIPGDKGTVTAALRDGAGRYRGYLNVTPRQGAEQLAGWAAFRAARNTTEGDTQERIFAVGENRRFTRARGSCVIDDYLSRVGSHPYRELACIVAGSRYTTVFVGATLVSDWSTLGPTVQRAAAALIVR